MENKLKNVEGLSLRLITILLCCMFFLAVNVTVYEVSTIKKEVLSSLEIWYL